MDTFVPPGYMTRTELVDVTGKVLFKDAWANAVGASAAAAATWARLDRAADREAAAWARADWRQAARPENAMRQDIIIALRATLYGGHISSVLVTSQGRLVDIPSHFWLGAGSIPAFYGGEEAVVDCDQGGFTSSYVGRVLFKRAEAEVWLAGHEAPALTNEAKAEAWFQAEVKGEKRQSRDDYRDEMVRRFNVSPRRALLIWGQVAPDPWKTAGPIRKSSR